VLGPIQANAYYDGARTWGLILGAGAAKLICGGLAMLRAQPQRMLLVATFSILVLALPLALLASPAAAGALIGPVADAIGTEATLYAAAALVIAATLPIFAVRDVRELRRK